METKKVKRKKFNIARTLVFILFIYIIVCLAIYVYNQPVLHYEITGNSYVSDATILRDAKLKDYPSFISVSSKYVKKLLEKNSLIKTATVKYAWNFTIKINIEENQPLFYLKNNNKICLADGTLIENNNLKIGVPVLINETPNKIMEAFSKNLNKVDRGILYTISEIQYAPSYNSDNQPIDEYRFLLTMTDKNQIIITVKKIELLNNYLNIISSEDVIKKGKGTLYLDSDYDWYVFESFKEGEVND